MALDVTECSCRVCLDKNASHDLFTIGKTVMVPYSDILSDILSLKVCHDDGLPQKICKKCTSKLVSAYEIKCLAYESYTKLLEYSKNKDVKHEIKVEGDGCTNADDTNILVQVKKEDFVDGTTILDFEGLHGVDVDSNDEDDNKPLIYTIDSTSFEGGQVKGSANVKRRRRVKIKKVNIKIPKDKKLIHSVCHLCGKLVRDIDKHTMTHSDKKLKYPCGDCHKVFVSITSRRRHRNVHHLGKLFYCEICKRDFKHSWQHMRLKHSTAPRPFTCVLCNKSFFTNGQLNLHLKFHTKEKSHKCEVCGKGFISSTEKNCHRRSVHEKERTVMCQYCSKRFFSNPDLKKHLKTHTGEKNYKCDECNKAFTRASGLKQHKKLHTGYKDITCEICSKGFYSAGNLKTHMITHTKEKNYACKYCGVKFGRTHHRDRHQKTAHENRIIK